MTLRSYSALTNRQNITVSHTCIQFINKVKFNNVTKTASGSYCYGFTSVCYSSVTELYKKNQVLVLSMKKHLAQSGEIFTRLQRPPSHFSSFSWRSPSCDANLQTAIILMLFTIIGSMRRLLCKRAVSSFPGEIVRLKKYDIDHGNCERAAVVSLRESCQFSGCRNPGFCCFC